MSRIGRMAIEIPKGVELNLQEKGIFTVKGPKGHLSMAFPKEFSVDESEGRFFITDNSSVKNSALHGTLCRNARNMVKGVCEFFEIKIELVGVGYKAETGSDNTIKLELGYSHPVFYQCKDSVKVTVAKNIITLQSIDKQALGQIAAELEALRKPEPYKGKGVCIVGKFLRRKEGKSKK